MSGFICRFCNGISDNDNGTMSLEISIRNRKIIVYVCLDCYAHLAESVIVRCQYCGNIWLQKEVRIGRGLRSAPHCYLCKGVDMGDATGIEHPSCS